MRYLVDEVRLTPGDLADWTVDRNEDTAQGRCPACHHRMTYDFESDAVAQGIAPREADGAPRRIDCRCRQSHLEGVTRHPSCGRWWYARIRPEGHVPPVVPELDETLKLAADELAASGRVAQEAAVRAAAEKWVAGVTALLGLFSLSGIAFGKDAFGGVAGVAKGVLATALILAVVVAALAVISTYCAAYGWPRVVDTSNVSGLRKWWRKRRAAPRAAADNLRRGVYLALTAVVALCVAAGIIWFGSAPPTPRVEVTQTDGSTVCGDLVSSTAAGTIRIHSAAGRVQTIAAGDIAKVSNVAKCEQ
ncbi:hypothetical protein RMN56_20780 [Micromonospora halotolerans]|uniref:Uncharacterized protein n=1 Tax=Micromonospora halotolerans TaxID=709879 RepID=A0ABY9ZQL8_9ACTN|nr:hypothetical protein [Micromonospora halotolerans]WNM37591.1 hypothetical protein RMN56_20780 [Micromonospora halotolerans]